MKHTLGPWNLYESNLLIEDSEGNAIARVCKEVDSDTPMRANAKLIAAAPDLLEAAQEMMNIYDSYGIALPTELKAKFMSAIKKATS